MEKDKTASEETVDAVEVERVFSEDKTVAQLILELVQKQYEG